MSWKRTVLAVIAAFCTGIAVGAAGMILLMNTPGDINENYNYQGTLTRIIDGDTIEVDDIRVRLVGIDTPEAGEHGYEEAAYFIAFICPAGSAVILDIDDKKTTDKYGRTLAVVYCNGVNVNQELLANGYADILFIPPSEFDPYSWI